MTAYYNEIEPYAAAWLRNLIAAGHIAPGDVDERSIEDVCPDDLRGYTQCHFFAGIGVWSHALRRVGWADDQPIWTASCPCQPFSTAGKGVGFTDERHLWPALFHLVTHRRPVRIVGEQVESPDGVAWLDLVQTDLEGAGYAPGATALSGSRVGAPEIRNRLYWMADTPRGGSGTGLRGGGSSEQRRIFPANCAAVCRLADPHDAVGRTDLAARDDGDRAHPGRPETTGDLEGCCGPGRLADDACCGRFEEHSIGVGSRRRDCPEGLAPGLDPSRAPSGVGVAPGPRPQGEPDGGYDLHRSSGPTAERTGGQSSRLAADRSAPEGLGHTESGRPPGFKIATTRCSDERARAWDGRSAESSRASRLVGVDQPIPGAEREQRSGQQRGVGGDQGAGDPGGSPGPVNGFWRSADWLLCRDPGGAKWRPVEPWTFPLAHGATARMGRLRAYGNAIIADAAVAFLKAIDETVSGS